MSNYNSLEEIDKDFKAKIEATEDADTRAVLVEQRAEAKADFRAAQAEAKFKAESEARETQLKARERQAWIKEALVEFPLAQQVPELIAGDTEDAVKGSAKAAHERIQKIQEQAAAAVKPTADTTAETSQQQIAQQAQQAYGSPVGGGSAPKEPSQQEQFLQDYVNRYNGDRGGTFWGERRAIMPAETDRYVRARGGEHMLARLLPPAEQKYGTDSPMVVALKQQIAGAAR